MQKYRKCSDVVDALKTMIDDQIKRSEYVLPGEVALAEKVGASRTTLRKALAQLEQENIIKRERRVTEIVEKRDVLAGCGKILFVASARCSTFIIPAFERLWMKLGPEVLAKGGNIELFLVNHMTSVSEWQEKLKSAKVILLTSYDSDNPKEMLKVLDEFERNEDRWLFSFMESITAMNQIYLDNYTTGSMAADALINAGCQRISAISFNYHIYDNIIFEKRIRGFVDRLKENNMAAGDCVKLVDYPHAGRFHPEIGDRYSRDARGVLEMIHRDGYDGVFIVSDEDIGIIAMNLFQQNVIPDKMKLITVNGVGDAMRHNPPLSCVNHATEGIVKIVMDKLRVIAENKAIDPGRIAVKPDLYVNETLGLK